jgi:hypothetical protein
MGSSQLKFSTNEVQGIVQLVELGRSIVAENVKTPTLSVADQPLQEWACYFEHCTTSFPTPTALTEHIQTQHQ